MAKTIIIPMAMDSEELESISVLNILRRANLNVLIYSKEEVIISARKTKILPDFKDLKTLDFDDIDGIILPGGIVGVQNLIKDTELVELTKNCLKANKLVGAICAAPLFLVHHNLIDANTKLTSHPSIINDLKDFNYSYDKVVIHKNLISSRGVGTALDFSFAIVDYFLGKNVSQEIKKEIVYN